MIMKPALRPEAGLLTLRPNFTGIIEMLGVCYYPEHWPEEWWAIDARRMREMGISFVRIGEFAWSKLEPSRDRFDWAWLDRAIQLLGEAGLKVVLGTPTATPPKWLVDECPDIIPYDMDGKPRGFGSRRHYTFSSETWWRESRRIVEKVAARYGKNPAVVGWQTDNEYGCHDTILSWGVEDLKAFRGWLRHNYQSTEQLNQAWGNVFWSMELQSFDEVSLPNLAVTELNPAARLDFQRFQSSQVAAYDKMQCDIIRAHAPGRWITHNFMGFFHAFDHWAVGENLDLASWDSYPIGFAEKFLPESEKHKWVETSHPDISGFHHDLYRGVGRGRWWVMEQQPGPVNWAPWNPIPKPGMVRLWTWEALAHGAEVVSYFRWRQAGMAQEQMHAGLNLPHSHELSPGGKEATQVGVELAKLGALPATKQAPVALVFDYESEWITAIQPQGQDFSYHGQCLRWYEAVRRLGLDVDIVRPGASLEGYKLVLVPSLLHVNEAAERAFAACKAVLLFGARTGSKTRHYQIPTNLPPGPLASLLKLRVIEVSSLRPGLVKSVKGKIAGKAERWIEHVESDAKPLAKFENGWGAFFAAGNAHYLACWADEKLLGSVMKHVVAAAKLKSIALPEGVRLRRRGSMIVAVNYGSKNWSLPRGAKLLLGAKILRPQEVAIFRDA
jgi:beta-galactosidase